MARKSKMIKECDFHVVTRVYKTDGVSDVFSHRSKARPARRPSPCRAPPRLRRTREVTRWRRARSEVPPRRRSATRSERAEAETARRGAVEPAWAGRAGRKSTGMVRWVHLAAGRTEHPSAGLRTGRV